ncbi:MAG: hypothetical protein WBB23_08970 [Desulforhopalus sp.]
MLGRECQQRPTKDLSGFNRAHNGHGQKLNGAITMRKQYIPTLLLIASLSITLMTFGCDSQGPAEKTGEKIDQSIEETKDAVEDVTDKITGEGPAEKLGEKVDETAETVKESTESQN